MLRVAVFYRIVIDNYCSIRQFGLCMEVDNENEMNLNDSYSPVVRARSLPVSLAKALEFA